MKTITPDNYIVRPFRVNKIWQYNYTHLSGSNSSSVSIDLATAPPSSWNTFVSGAGSQNLDGIYKSLLYTSIQHTFYTGSGVTGSRYTPIDGRDKRFYPTGSQFYVVNIEQRSFGESIRPNSFYMSASVSTASIIDDGEGRLVSSINPATIIGNIFYRSGVAVIKQDTGSYSGSLITDRGLYLATGSVVAVQYAGIHTIYEHQIICTVEPNELNFSTNPTLRNNTLSGSLSGSVFTSATGPLATDLIFSGTLEPYFTTIGLYNDIGEMVAIAKVPTPLRRSINTQQTVIVRLDA